MCASLHDVMKEILLGVEMETVNSETYNRYLDPLKTKQNYNFMAIILGLYIYILRPETTVSLSVLFPCIYLLFPFLYFLFNLSVAPVSIFVSLVSDG